MTKLNIMASRHSAFYSPMICTIAGGFLEKEGLTGEYHVVEEGGSSGGAVAEGRMDVAQAAVSASWGPMDSGLRAPFAHFAQINRYDGFFIAGREADSAFSWDNLLSSRFLYVHGGQPEAMLRYGAHKMGIDLSAVDDIYSPGGNEMMGQWRNGQGDYFHEQGSFPQQLEYDGQGHILASVGEAVGPVAFSSLVGRWDWLETDEAKRFATAFKASREWVNTADPGEIAKAEASFFPDMAESAIASAVSAYQNLGTWSGGIAIEKDLYESALDVFEHSKMVGSRHSYNDVVVAPPGI
ncbi:MAG: ABC transporter substrate-binding protein [Chloroflexi bacterium]|nr:ABC transporter substrate-binding protein [Chloroflexota bacterium]